MPDRKIGKDTGTSIIDEVKRKIEKLNSMADISSEDLVEYAEGVGDHLANKVRLKTSQIRKFLDAVNDIKSRSSGKENFNFKESVTLLRPKLAWAAGRQEQVKPLMDVLEPCMKRVKDKDDFFKFSRFLEAIIAYHRYYGGRD